MSTFSVTFEPDGLTGQFPAGTTLFRAAGQLGIELRSDCGQKGKCGKCKIRLDSSDMSQTASEAEQQVLMADELALGWRLACQSYAEKALVANVPQDSRAVPCHTGKEGLCGSFRGHPAVSRHFLSATDLARQSGIDTLKDVQVPAAGKMENVTISSILRQKLKTVSPDDGITIVHHTERGCIKVLPGRRCTSLGLTLDIGTTTLGVYLCDLTNGSVLASRAAANPQRRYGEDVISRIQHITEDSTALGNLQRTTAKSLEEVIHRCLAEWEGEIEDIDEIVVVGNTVMQHILAGLDPTTIGVSPYRPLSHAPLSTRGGSLGLESLGDVPAYVFPVVSGFLGGDILACWLAESSSSPQKTSLIIDIGTNGELLLFNQKGVWATSCATGPALEGAMISCGMRASTGAIYRFSYHPQTQEISYHTLGGGAPRGICGSGIIDLLAVLRKAGVVKADGSMNGDAQGVVCDERGNGRKFLVPDSNIVLTLKDIRQVQLAKAALRVGIEALLEESGAGMVDNVALTGAFGAGFDWKSARDIGMLPESICMAKVDSRPHLAGIGGIKALVDSRNRKKVVDIATRIHSIDLAGLVDFTWRFARATRFP